MITDKVFKSNESRDRIRSRYNQILSVFPFKQRYVETTFGSTFILESGSSDNPALFLLHGSCSNSAFWFGEITALTNMFHVIAVDIIGEAGNSEENRPDLNTDNYADWFMQVLSAFSTKKAVIIGNSLGSWIALKFAVKYPDFVSRLILIAPPGLSEQNNEFLDRARKAMQRNEELTMSPTIAQGVELPKEVEEFINLICGGYNPITEVLPAFEDERLMKLTMPVLFIAGECDDMVDTISAAQRLKYFVPEAEVHLLEGIGHVVVNALEYIMPFLIRR